MSENKNFLQMSIKKEGVYGLISIEDFLAIDLDERIKLISDGHIQFLIDGKPLPLREGLIKLKSSG